MGYLSPAFPEQLLSLFPIQRWGVLSCSLEGATPWYVNADPEDNLDETPYEKEPAKGRMRRLSYAKGGNEDAYGRDCLEAEDNGANEHIVGYRVV